ncbi:MAG: hypothetical protein EOP32_17405, partial [Rhodococcus sp. (in: high G+C Gram-positive bacteria)]
HAARSPCTTPVAHHILQRSAIRPAGTLGADSHFRPGPPEKHSHSALDYLAPVEFEQRLIASSTLSIAA